MSRRYQSSKSTALSIGWLFADLLLALAVLFLLTNTNMPPRVRATATATATPTPTPRPSPTPKPTPVPIPRLELKFHRITLQIDATGLLNNDPQAINNIEQQVRAQGILHGRSVGLVIAYGGAPTSNDIGTADSIASKVYDILRTMGKQKFAFTQASYYNTLYLLGGDVNTVVLDIYLFAK